MLTKYFIPKLPFEGFKWKWASLQCTEGINDPVVLLGVLFRMRKLDGNHLKYNSDEFAHELSELANDIKDTNIKIDIARRTGERNIIRNSGQYWRALGLIPTANKQGIIQLTRFGQLVADRIISQSEFAAITIQTFKLPNSIIQSESECKAWLEHNLEILPLMLLLKISQQLFENNEDAYLTKDELINIIIPLSGTPNIRVDDYVNFIKWNRNSEIDLSKWPKCCPVSNDHRIAREFLLFLSNYGYFNQIKDNGVEKFCYNDELDAEIKEIISMKHSDSRTQTLKQLRSTDVTSDIERKRVQITRCRPNQARFRKQVLMVCPRCIITNVAMPEVLEAAHIKPFKYNGEDTVANGLSMRMDIHQLFDAGHLRISEIGEVNLSDRARREYGATIPPCIVVPDFINRDFMRWRWENYNGV